ncbi:MAG TPA: hypothetical protein VH257_03410, partial [Chloroflexota bacterium]|nr:hypothetical protein [Chloroflexota bacterium]
MNRAPLYQSGERPPGGRPGDGPRRGMATAIGSIVALTIVGAGLGQGVDAMRQLPPEPTPTAQAAAPAAAPRQGWIPALTRSLTILALEQADAFATAAAQSDPSPVPPSATPVPAPAPPSPTAVPPPATPAPLVAAPAPPAAVPEA